MRLWGAAALLIALGVVAPRLGMSASAPTGRCAHTAILDSLRRRMLVFGGTGGKQLWALSLDDVFGWQLVSDAPAAPRRAFHVAILDPVRDRLVIFGGLDTQTRRNDVWVFPLSQDGPWSPLAVAGTPPVPRSHHCAIYDPIRDRLIVFGGYTGADNLNDVWALSLSGTPTWTEILPSGTAPSPRRECSAVYDPARDRMIVIGGVGNAYFNDTWALSLGDSPQWTQLDAGTSGPLPRSGHSSVYDPARDLIWLFGGGDPNYHNDLWTLSLSGTPTWRQVSPQGTLPGGRAYHSAVLDPSTDRVVVFAGWNGGYLSDTWLLEQNSATWFDVSSPPEFLVPVASPGTIELGETFSVTVKAWNTGPTKDGRISVSFPALGDSVDGQWVDVTTTGDPSAIVEQPAGTSLVSETCQPVVASCLAVEYRDGGWPNGKTHDLTLTVRPRAEGTFSIYVRATMPVSGTSCLHVNGLPEGELGFVDQQGFPVTRYVVTVRRPPIPHFVGPVAGIPSTLQLGQSFTLTASVRNDGGTSDDGRIIVSFPAFTQREDGEWASSPSAGDSPGYVERPVGSPLLGASCQSIVGGYLVAEYADDNWVGHGAEKDELVLTVTPRVEGTFYVDVRATMHRAGAAGCAYVTVPSDSGGTLIIDQQGWPATRYAVQVLPATPTTAWSRITAPPGGPIPRFSASMVYHPGRDALVLYGGANGNYSYLTDTWVLPLASGGSWTQLTPGGPDPRSRFKQSMILNPVEDHLVIFGGYHDVELNDLTALALSPLVWWFPATPNGPQPSPRFGASAIYDPLRRRMLVIGGYGNASGYVNDVWEYRLPGNGTWTQLHPAGTPMPGRTLSAAVYDPVRDRVLVFGGDPFRNDVWELTLGGTLAWNELHPSGSLPEVRRQHTMIYDPVRDRLVVFGGYYLHRQNDVWALSLRDSMAWTQLFSPTAPPSPRLAHAAVYDPVRDQMVVFGGDVGTNQFSNELWALTLDTTTPTEISFGGADATSQRVRLTWVATDASQLQADVERSVGAGSEWTVLGSASLEGDHLVFEDHDVVAGTRYGYRLVERAPDRGTVLDEQWVTVPPRAVLALSGASPNPAPDDLWVSFSLPAEGRATLELFDLKGRMLARREVGSLGPGEHRIVLSESRRLPAGVYLVRLTRADRVLNAKACVIK